MNYRNTKQKQLILSTIEKHGHLSVEQIKDLLSDEKISIATIYRNLNILTLEHKIKKVFSDDLVVYETIKNEHYHFECLKCKKVIDIDPKCIKINMNHSFAEVSRKALFLYGTCNECKNKE